MVRNWHDLIYLFVGAVVVSHSSSDALWVGVLSCSQLCLQHKRSCWHLVGASSISLARRPTQGFWTVCYLWGLDLPSSFRPFWYPDLNQTPCYSLFHKTLLFPSKPFHSFQIHTYLCVYILSPPTDCKFQQGKDCTPYIPWGIYIIYILATAPYAWHIVGAHLFCIKWVLKYSSQV